MLTPNVSPSKCNCIVMLEVVLTLSVFLLVLKRGEAMLVPEMGLKPPCPPVPGDSPVDGTPLPGGGVGRINRLLLDGLAARLIFPGPLGLGGLAAFLGPRPLAGRIPNGDRRGRRRRRATRGRRRWLRKRRSLHDLS
uniref:Uncharacterized protein n=1 Tax=Arundo donax TaxID=35708 RepID=A0A0A9D462_ARUDO